METQELEQIAQWSDELYYRLQMAEITIADSFTLQANGRYSQGQGKVLVGAPSK